MIDTITISIPVTSRNVRNLEQFQPFASNIFTTDRGFRSYRRNPSSKEREFQIYVPIYTLYRRYRNGLQIILNIQFSIPKLIYGNNFQEVSQQDFPQVIELLQKKLSLHKIIISKEKLSNAKVAVIHFSKNILLSDGLNCSMVINQLSKALDVNLRKDFKQVQFKNGGQIIHIHTNDYEFAIYDKVKELEQSKLSKHRSIETQNYSQLNLLDDNLVNNYLRLELRLTGQKAISRLLKVYAGSSQVRLLTFRNLFDKELSKTMITKYWEAVIRDRYLNIVWKKMDASDLLYSIMSNNKTLTERELIEAMFLQTIIADRGIRELRSTMGWTGSNSYKWSKRKKLLKKLKIQDSRLYIIKDIDMQLQDYISFNQIPKILTHQNL